MTLADSAQKVRTDRIVIAGLPRSGTTYIGKILDAHPDIRMVLEPLNEEFGLRSVDGQFPYVGQGSGPDRDAAAQLLDDVVELRGGWRRLRMSRGNDQSAVRKAAKVLVGSRTSLDWRADHLSEAVGRPRVGIQCIKDPFATFSLDYLWEQHQIRSMCMVRHPGAYYQSFIAQPWEFGIGRLPQRDALRRDFGETVSDDLWKKAFDDKLAYCAVLWKLMANYANSTREIVKIVRHEDLAADVVAHSEAICEYFGFEFRPEMREFVESTISGSSVAPEHLKVRSFVRDTSKVADHWRSVISGPDETRLRDAIGEDLELFYEGWE